MKYLRAFYGQCNPIPFTNGSGGELTTGDLAAQSGKVGVVYGSGPTGDVVAAGEEGIMLTGVPAPGVLVPKTAGVALTAGDAVHYDSANGAVDDGTATGAKLGYAYKDAAAGDARAQVVLTDETA